MGVNSSKMKNLILQAVVVEDEQESLDLLKDLIDSTGKAKVTGSTSNPDEAVNLILSREPDIVFPRHKNARQRRI